MKFLTNIIKKLRSSVFAEYVSMFLVIVALFFVVFLVSSKVSENKEASFAFRCPESYSSDEDRAVAYEEYILAVMEKNPDITVEDLVKQRYADLVSAGCEQTLENVGDLKTFSRATVKNIESEQPPRITGNETTEELYNNPYLTHIRIALNGYLDGSNIGAEEIVAMEQEEIFSTGDECGLKQYRSYLSSPFLIYGVADSEYGGIQARIVFVDKPDSIFWAWVYQLGWDSGEYSLRGFCRVGPPEDKQSEFTEIIRSLIERGEVGPTL